MLIIWDKIFGTFAEEITEPQFGLTKSLGSYSFLWQHFHYVLELTVAFRMAKTLRQKAKVIFGGPSDIDGRIRLLLERKYSQKTADIQYSQKLIRAVVSKTIVTVAVLFFTILFSEYLTGVELFLMTGFIILSVIITGAMLEQKKWIFHLEFLRMAVASYAALSFFSNPYFIVIQVLLGVVIVLFYQTIHSRYKEFLFSN